MFGDLRLERPDPLGVDHAGDAFHNQDVAFVAERLRQRFRGDPAESGVVARDVDVLHRTVEPAVHRDQENAFFLRLFADVGKRPRLLRQDHQRLDALDQQVFNLVDLLGGVARGGDDDFILRILRLDPFFRLFGAVDDSAGPAVVGGGNRHADFRLLRLRVSAGGQPECQQRRAEKHQQFFHDLTLPSVYIESIPR
ncbi:hypothetical protein SDC9_133251 [bioreactor metagenome]|uniref:Uncharacterized protein n=1 Tax=bioreactor metagenome TaxID=1076179 RepID=A0A645D9S8_9ZZZZ